MLVRSSGKTARVPAAESKAPAEGTVDHLLRKLVARASTPARTTGASQPIPTDQPVLLDTEIDGVRCVLVRSPPIPAAAPRSPSAARPRGPAPRPVLSPREQEIVRMVAQGYPNKIIADVLEISTWTVGTHLRRIFAKLTVTSRAAMVARILQDDLLRGRDP